MSKEWEENNIKHCLYRILDSKKTSRFQFSVPGLPEIHRNLKQQNKIKFMHRFKSAILEKLKNCQNGTFKPVHEIWNFFWPKAFFWSIMKMAIRKNIHSMPQGLPNPGFVQEKVQRGDFLWCPMMKTNFNPFFRFYPSRVHDFC